MIIDRKKSMELGYTVFKSESQPKVEKVEKVEKKPKKVEISESKDEDKSESIGFRDEE